jgi:hypothetical protein
MMTRHEILDLIRNLANSTGLYGRLWYDICGMDEDDKEEMFAYWEELNFADDLEFIRWYEEGILPAGYNRRAMTDQEIKQAVAEQLSNMITNNIVNGYGVESFRGWVEDGNTFAQLGMTESEVERAMKLVAEVETATDIINEVLGENPYLGE